MYTYNAYLIRAIDADTLEVEIDLGFGTFTRQVIRLLGVDAWEPRGANKAKGKAAKEALLEYLEAYDRHMVLHSHKVRGKNQTGTFGRYLADIYVGGVSIAKWLADNGHLKEQ